MLTCSVWMYLSRSSLMSVVVTDVAAEEGAASIVEMLFCTSLVAVVGAGDKPSSSPRKLRIVNTKVRSSADNCP